MGGRGAASGVSVKGYEYGSEFKCLLKADNIKFVQYQIAIPAKAPLETMSAGRNRVYVLVKSANKEPLKSIVFYNKQGLRRRQIDLDHDHDKMQPHVHIWRDNTKSTVPLTKSDVAYIEKVRRIWKNQP
jgi:hypothetical protein